MISLKISGCGDCPFCNYNPEDGNSCNFPKSVVEDENVDRNSETYPKNCPLINQVVTINQNNNSGEIRGFVEKVEKIYQESEYQRFERQLLPTPPYDKAWYQRNFSLGEFIYETIGLGRSLAIGETQLDAIKAIEKDIVELHLEKNKEMYEQRGTSVKNVSFIIPTGDDDVEAEEDYLKSGVKGLGLKKNRMEAVKFPPTEAIITQYNNAVKNNNTVIINSLELVYDIPETIKQKA